ncbi:porin PorA family protein [Corynebacterium appendicis]|nr:porin PorA family protein [Corynebacterium appendicis]MDK8626434.1 porin PorA family protein [Corynebacterium appendicis]
MKRLYWCVAVFVVGMVLGTMVAPPIVTAMKPLKNGVTTLTWTGGVTEEIEVAGAKKDATVTVRGPGGEYSDEISRYTAETSRGLVFLFPFKPDRRSFRFYDPAGDAQGTVDYVGPGRVDGLGTYEFHGTFDGDDYHAERTFEVERRTGTLIDATWETADGTRTLDDATRAAQLSLAHDRVRVLKILQFLAWLGGFMAVVAAAAGVVIFVRR